MLLGVVADENWLFSSGYGGIETVSSGGHRGGSRSVQEGNRNVGCVTFRIVLLGVVADRNYSFSRSGDHWWFGLQGWVR